MRAFTIKAKSLDSAQKLFDALRRFDPSLHGSVGEGYSVTVDVGANDRRVIEVLDAIQEHAQEHHDSARVELEGRSYTVHPE